MTNPIPPCPPCGAVPKTHSRVAAACYPQCKCLWTGNIIAVELWITLCRDSWVGELESRGIHTLAELESLPPDLPRASSEIEREASPIAQKAARALLDATLADMVDTAQPNGIDCMYGEIAALCHDYLSAMSYARSIGAIE